MKKTLGISLIASAFLLFSCVDYTYDIANKEISTDVEIKGNKLSLPLGSLCPIPLDSLLMDSLLESIPMLKVDEATRAYSLSLNDSLKTGVDKENLEALKNVSKLSADIAPISIPIGEISFDPEGYSHKKDLEFEEVELSDITLNKIEENITLKLDELTLEPITIPGEKEPRSVKFDIPTVSLNDINIGGGEPQTTNFSISDINLNGVELSNIDEAIDIKVTKIDMTKNPRGFNHTQPLTLSDATMDGYLNSIPGGENMQIPITKTIAINTTNSEEESYTVDIEFDYDIPEQIKDIDRIVLAPKTSEVKFVLKNPTIVQENENLNTNLDFHISFPEGYKLSDPNKPEYTLSENRNEITASIPISGKETYVTFHLEEIGNLGGKIQNGKISFTDQATCTIKYKVEGDVTLKAGTTVGKVREGLQYSFGLNVNFAVSEAYGSINPVESSFEAQDIPFSFSLDNLEYIKSISTVQLTNSKLQFTMGLTEGFDNFDIADDSRLVLSFPDAFVFSTTDMVLPSGVKQSTKRANDFEITSFEAFSTTASWTLPISEIKINQNVENGKLAFSTQATVKAVTGSKDGSLTVKTKNNNFDLMAAVEKLCTTRTVELKADGIVLNIEDVKGATNTIDIEFAKQTFDFDFEVGGNLKYISHIDFVEFDAANPITIIPSVGSLGSFQLETGSCIALRFPKDFVFDTQNSTLRYDRTLEAFVIDNLSQLEAEEWKFYLQKINVDKEVNGTLSFDEEVVLEAINKNASDNYLHIVGNDNFSLKEMRDQGLLGTQGQNLSFEIKESSIKVKEVQLDSKDINVDFPSPENITYPISIEGLEYITRVGSIEFKEGDNILEFSSQVLGKALGKFKLAQNSYIELQFPTEFKLDPKASDIPQGGAVFTDSSTIRITSLEALNHNWKLAVKRIALNKNIDNQSFKQNYAINITSYNTSNQKDKLTIAAIENLKLTEIEGGQREMQISVKESKIIIADVEVSVENIDIDFSKQVFTAPIPTIENLDLVKEIKHITFEDGEGKNTIRLNISLDGDLGNFDLVDSRIKISLPSEFVLNLEKCNFNKIAGLKYNEAEKAIYLESIQSIINNPIQLALKQIDINQTIVDNKFDWEVKFSVEAIANSNEPNKLYVGCGNNNLKFSEVSSMMGNKTIQILVEEATLSIDEAVIISNGVSEKIEEEVKIPIKETITEAIDRIDFIGFAQPVPMTLNISTKGLENLDVPVKILADITFPPVFDISSNDDNITITEQGLRIDTAYSFKENEDIRLELLVNSLDFTTLEGGCLALTPADNGARVLEYNGNAAINGSVSIADATISSNLLKGVSMDINFDMGKVVLKDFTGLYNGAIEPIIQNFELGIENGFDELKENGIILTNTKPELMISIYNPIGVPVDVDLSIVGKDKDGNVISTSVISPENTLRIKPAKFDKQGELVADTTRWFFTSNQEVEVPAGYESIVIKNLATLFDELPYSIEFSLIPTIVTENVKHHVDLTKLDLGGSYAISVPFDLKFEQSIPLDFDEEINGILSNENNTLSLANPQLALSIHNPIADSLVFDLTIIGKDENGQPIETFTIDFSDDPFVLKAGVRNESDGTITPTATRWLFAVSEDIKKEGYETKVAPALGSLLANIPHDIDIALNAHFNTNLTKQIDYNNDLELMCEYGISVPLQFEDLHLSYADTISEIQFNLQETLDEMNISITNIELGMAMNLKNTLPLGLKLNLIPLDAQNKPIKGIEIGSIDIPAGSGAAIMEEKTKGTPIEFSIRCDSPDTLSALDKIAFSIEVESGNGDHALSGKQGLQICDIVLQIMCDVEI